MSETATGFDKQKYMDYSVGFRKFISENEFLLSAELWDFLSETTNTMKTILEIINSIATTEFLEIYDFLNNSKNRQDDKNYVKKLKAWYLFRELDLVKNDNLVLEKISKTKLLHRTYNANLFKSKAEYNETRINKLINLI